MTESQNSPTDDGGQQTLAEEDEERWKRLNEMPYSELSDSEATAKAKLALKRRFDESAWTLVFEFTGPDRRRADAIAVSKTRSNGFKIIVLEIKASRSDWKSEKKDPRKQEHFIGLADEFYVVAARKGIVREKELPKGWGLLELKPNSERLYKEVESDLSEEQAGSPSRRFWAKLLGKLEDGADGFSEDDLIEARSKGYDEGLEEGRRRASFSDDEAERKARKWEDLTDYVRISYLDNEEKLRALGAAYEIVERFDENADHGLIRRLDRLEERVQDRADEAVEKLEALREPLAEMAEDPESPPLVEGGEVSND